LTESCGLQVPFPTYTPPEKAAVKLYLRLRAQTLQGFFDKLISHIPSVKEADPEFSF
jgi:hypothetical protein